MELWGTHSGLPPEEQEFLRGLHLRIIYSYGLLIVRTGWVVDDARLEQHQCY